MKLEHLRCLSVFNYGENHGHDESKKNHPLTETPESNLTDEKIRIFLISSDLTR
jgi:hypothetical protein